jgi:hypothetical protein
MTPAGVRAVIDEGPFLAEQAKTKRLVDDLYFEDQVTGELKKRLGQTEVERISHHDYARVPPSGARRKWR